MALNVSTLTGYVEEKKTGLIRKAVIESRSAHEMNLMTGIKGATALNLLNTTVVFGDGSVCGWNEAGTSEVTKRILTPGYVKVNMSFCDKTLLNTWMNYDVRLAAGQKTLPFEEDAEAYEEQHPQEHAYLQKTETKRKARPWQKQCSTNFYHSNQAYQANGK